MVIEDTSVAIAKKGLRKIVVGNETYYWKFTGTVFVFRDEGKFSQLSVDLGWKDIWLSFGGPESASMQNQMKSVTPKFVADAISYARDHGWDQGSIKLEYKNKNFSLAK